jgi:polar amino acid transport system substrate-binding protein
MSVWACPSRHMSWSDSTQAVTFHRIFPEGPRRAVFRDVRVGDAFNSGLKNIQANGTYDALVRQYLGPRP